MLALSPPPPDAPPPLKAADSWAFCAANFGDLLRLPSTLGFPRLAPIVVVIAVVVVAVVAVVGEDG
jgi:uncharacterized protein (DUF2237 family)